MSGVGGAADDLDDWQRKFKIENGRLVCINENKQNSSLYHFVPPPPSHASPKPRRSKAPVRAQQRKTIVVPNTRVWQPLKDLVSPPPTAVPTAPVAPSPPLYRPSWHVQKYPPASVPDCYTLASQLRDDPDPEYQVVDVQSDNEFLIGIEEEGPLTFHDIDSAGPAPSTIYQNEIQLKNLRERAEMAVTRAMESPSEGELRMQKSGEDKGRVREEEREEFSSIERVLRELSIKAVPADDSQSSTSAAESHHNGKVGGMGDTGEVELRGAAGTLGATFPRRVVALSKVFARDMDKDGFEGVIRLEEEDAFAMRELISWLSRDIDFEVTIGIPHIPKKSDVD
jgi:hypothetical protein